MQNGNHEIWDCQGGPVHVPVDSDGCPLEQKYCKIQLGPQGPGPFAVAAGGSLTLTFAVQDFTYAKVKGLVIQANDPAAGAGTDYLQNLVVTQIRIQGIDNIDGEVPAQRYASDATGSGPRGTGQSYRGTLGSAGGQATVVVRNDGPATANVAAAFDANAVR